MGFSVVIDILEAGEGSLSFLDKDTNGKNIFVLERFKTFESTCSEDA